MPPKAQRRRGQTRAATPTRSRSGRMRRELWREARQSIPSGRKPRRPCCGKWAKIRGADPAAAARYRESGEPCRRGRNRPTFAKSAFSEVPSTTPGYFGTPSAGLGFSLRQQARGRDRQRPAAHDPAVKGDPPARSVASSIRAAWHGRSAGCTKNGADRRCLFRAPDVAPVHLARPKAEQWRLASPDAAASLDYDPRVRRSKFTALRNGVVIRHDVELLKATISRRNCITSKVAFWAVLTAARNCVSSLSGSGRT